MSTRHALVYGSDALRAAESLRQQKRKDAAWPYDWEYAPPGSKEDQVVNYVAVPAAGILTEVCEYSVADGLHFYPTDVALVLMGVAYSPGDFTWSLTINSPADVAAPQAFTMDGYASVPVSLGTLEIPWKLPRAERNLLHSRDVMRIVVSNVNLGAGGAFFVGVIKGYLFSGE